MKFGQVVTLACVKLVLLAAGGRVSASQLSYKSHFSFSQPCILIKYIQVLALYHLVIKHGKLEHLPFFFFMICFLKRHTFIENQWTLNWTKSWVHFAPGDPGFPSRASGQPPGQQQFQPQGGPVGRLLGRPCGQRLGHLGLSCGILLKENAAENGTVFCFFFLRNDVFC